MSKNVLLLDDENHIRVNLGNILLDHGYTVFRAATRDEAKKVVLSEHIDFAVVDLIIDYESDYGGIDIINYIKRVQPKTKTIIYSAYKLDSKAKSSLEFEVEGYIDKGGVENSMRAVINKLHMLSDTSLEKNCFVIMPFSDTETCSEDEWTEIFFNLIKPAVENAGLNYKCIRSEALIGSIIENILSDLNRADVVIADLTDRNPNVFYELGVRQSIRDSTILITQNINDIPFDLRHQATQVYNWKLAKNRSEFEVALKKILLLIESDPEKAKSPIRKYLDFNQS